MTMALGIGKSVVDRKDSLDGASIASFYASLVGLSNRAGDAEAGNGGIRDAPGHSEAGPGVGNTSREIPVERLLNRGRHDETEKREKYTEVEEILSNRIDSHREAGSSLRDDCTDIQQDWRSPSQSVDGAGPRPGVNKGFQTKTFDHSDFSKEQRNFEPGSFGGGSSGRNLDGGGQGVRSLGAQDKRAPAYRMKIPEENIGYKMLKKAGWNEKTGLGASGQGPLEPLNAHMKGDKRGIGADKQAKQVPGVSSTKKRKDVPESGTSADRGKRQLTRAELKQKKEREKEKEEAIAKYIYRAFAPDNV
ncbi:hypothetical protein KFL_000140310 [Klebsormidium nitens]|uniref:G-patch domain-containing protein n=1 Tax=Klebsormidium nitens TaxID=105231 RepID=A0A1Y1HNF0_KLENI|nr:hypothetical protein KFL_000140310 [Klebsormidium nitens]|eukprot:GAQ78511.1 hypothetical protein KFL_000140310 [Klebsormidium nitens]